MNKTGFHKEKDLKKQRWILKSLPCKSWVLDNFLVRKFACSKKFDSKKSDQKNITYSNNQKIKKKSNIFGIPRIKIIAYSPRIPRTPSDFQ